jgi:hypothetical protein
MKQKNLLLRYFGLLVLILGIALNVKMFLNQEWPTILFFIICFIGIIQILISFVFKRMSVTWQIFLSLIPFIIGFAYIKLA